MLCMLYAMSSSVNVLLSIDMKRKQQLLPQTVLLDKIVYEILSPVSVTFGILALLSSSGTSSAKL